MSWNYSDNTIIVNTPSITTVSQVVLQANPVRKGLVIYNNSSNSVYIAFAPTCSSASKMTLIIPTFSQYVMQLPIYGGVISAIRNSGTGSLLITESV